MSSQYDLASALDGFVLSADGAERAVRIVVAPTGLRAREVQSGAEHVLPWSSAKLERRERDGALVVRTKLGAVGSAAPDFLRAIEAAVGNELGDQIARLSGERTGLRMSGWFGCLVFAALCVALVLSVPGCLRRGVDAAVEAAPFSVDEALGDAAAGALDMGPEVTDERVTAAIDAIVARLARGVEATPGKPTVTWQVRVVRNEVINAFALPGGHLTVFTGLLAAAKSPEMVAGVLAHEMAHVTERHGLRRVGQSLGFFAALQLVFGDASGLSRIAKEVLSAASVNAYSRDQEVEADIVGVRFLHAARVDPRGLGEFFRLLKEKQGDLPEALEWLSSHPQHTARVAATGAEAERLGLVTWEPLAVDWEAVQAALAGG